MNHKTDIQQIIIRYLDGECSLSERQELNQWLEKSESNKDTFYQIKDVWDASLKKEDRTNAALLHFYREQATKDHASTKVLHIWKTVASVAAVLAIGFITLFMLQTVNKESVKQPASALVSFKVPLGSVQK
jgi:ferric-dicitrate binding protein FerR (iron transport regulator)